MKHDQKAGRGTLNEGDNFTIAGVYENDDRSFLRWILDKLLRRQDPTKKLAVFKCVRNYTIKC